MKIEYCIDLLRDVPEDKQLKYLAEVLMSLIRRIGDMYVLPSRYGTCLMRLKHVLLTVARSTGDPADLAMANFNIRCESMWCYLPHAVYEVLLYSYSRLG